MPLNLLLYLKVMKKLTSFFILFIFCSTTAIRPAHAILPAAAIVPIAAAALGSLLVVGGAQYYTPAVYEAGQYAVDSISGVMSKSLYMTKAIAIGAEQYIFGRMVAAEMAFDKLMQNIDSMGSSVPNLKAARDAATQPDPVAEGNVFNGYLIGPEINFLPELINGVEPHPNPVLGPSYPYFPPPAGTSVFPYFHWDSFTYNWWSFRYDTSRPNDPRYLYDRHQHSMTATEEPDYTKPPMVSPSDFANNIPVDDLAVANELNALTEAHPNDLTVDAPPFTAAEVNQMYSAVAADTAQDYADQVAGEAALDPTNQELQSLAFEAQYLADQAALEAQKEEVVSEQEIFTPPAVPSVNEAQIDFAPLLALKDKALSKFPFSLASSISGLYSGLTAIPVAPEFPFKWGNIDKTISLSVWDSGSAFIRMVMAFFFHGSIIYAITRRWSS